MREGEWKKGGLFLLLTLISSLPMSVVLPGGIDFTLSGQFRANSVTTHTMAHLEDPLYIRWYHTGDLENLFPQARTLDLFFDSLKFTGGWDLHITEHSPQKGTSLEEVTLLGQERGWSEQSYEVQGEYKTLFSALEVEYRGRTETIPLVFSPILLEEQLLWAIQRLESDSHPRLALLSGREDRPLNEFWTILSASLGEFYGIDDYTGQTDLLEHNNPQALFVMGDRDLSDWEASRVISYVEGGGAAVVTLSSLELNPQDSDLIVPAQKSGLRRELENRGMTLGEHYIVDPYRPLYLSSEDSTAPDLYPLWFRSGHQNLFTYYTLWSTPIYYTGDRTPLWSAHSSDQSYLAMGLRDISPQALYRIPLTEGTSYITAMALPLGEGILVVLSGEESLSDLMVLSNTNGYNAAWAQNLAFFLTGNEDLLALRESSLGGRFP